ncbi:MAG: hypothetical protein IJ551_09135 [Prevotella sp.]|nr:hypothetical protein [Prevotella sp.]
MKQLTKIFALFAMMLLGGMKASAGEAVIRLDFMAKHPAVSLRIDEGFAVRKGNYNFWSGQWSALFGGKIAFATDSYPVLRNNGGLVDYHDGRKMYVLGLSVGDKVTFNYSGSNARIEYHTVGTARLGGLSSNYELVESGFTYTVTQAGDLSVQTKFTQDERVTVIESVIIEPVSSVERISITEGMRTYCSNNPLSFSRKRAIKAYVATDFKDGHFIFEQVSYVPANTGFLLVRRGNTTSFDVNIGISSDPKENYIERNLFTGVMTTTAIPSDDGADHYVVGMTDNGPGIFKVNAGYSCKAKSAYLTVPK